ncbi:MAG: hypothetical protein R2736_09825 [Solirubrobacterales bacterium]
MEHDRHGDVAALLIREPLSLCDAGMQVALQGRGALRIELERDADGAVIARDVEVLQRPTLGLRADQLDQPRLNEDADVVADDPDRLLDGLSELAWARGALAQLRQEFCPDGMGQGPLYESATIARRAQSPTSRIALRSTRSSISPMRPVSSARGMNCDGSTSRPVSLRCQRTSASTPWIRSSGSWTTGW